MKLNRSLKFGFTAALSITSAFAVTPTIGVASAFGTFMVNSAEVQGNANIFEGSQIKTGKASSQIFLQNGAAVVLGANSAGTIYRDHLLLQSGATKVDNMQGYTVQAAMYRIQADQPISEAVVRVDGDTIEVAALSGSLKVLNENGALLTHIGAGTASAFQAGATAGQGGATTDTDNRKKKKIGLFFLLASLVGLGLAVDAILQPTTSP